MLIGVDYDEVVAELLEGLLVHYNKKHGTNFRKSDFHSYNFWEVWGGTIEDAKKEVFDFYANPMFENIRPIEGSQIITKIISKKHDLVIITSRPDKIRNESRQWLKKYFPGRFSGVYFTNDWGFNGHKMKKSGLCKELGVDMLIDDSLSYAKDCASCGTKVLLYNQPWNQSNGLPDSVKRVNSWYDILKEFNH